MSFALGWRSLFCPAESRGQHVRSLFRVRAPSSATLADPPARSQPSPSRPRRSVRHSGCKASCFPVSLKRWASMIDFAPMVLPAGPRQPAALICARDRQIWAPLARSAQRCQLLCLVFDCCTAPARRPRLPPAAAANPATSANPRGFSIGLRPWVRLASARSER
jgi:hypothetical protein